MQKLNTPASLMCFSAVFLINYACAEIFLMWSGLICNTCPLLPALTLTCERTHSTAGKSKPPAAIASCTGTSSFLSLRSCSFERDFISQNQWSKDIYRKTSRIEIRARLHKTPITTTGIRTCTRNLSELY